MNITKTRTTTTFSKTPLSFCWASSLKTDLLLHLLLRCYSQPEVGVNHKEQIRSWHLSSQGPEGSRSQSKWKSKSSQWVSWPHTWLPVTSDLIHCLPLLGFALPWASWPPCSCWNWQPCSKLKALEPHVHNQYLVRYSCFSHALLTLKLFVSSHHTFH